MVRRDDVRLHHSVHWTISEPCADLAGGGVGCLNQPIGVSGLDLVAKRGTLAEADGWIPATRRHTASRQGFLGNVAEAGASHLGSPDATQCGAELPGSSHRLLPGYPASQ